MRKLTVLFAVLAGCLWLASAQAQSKNDGDTTPPKPLDEWTFFQIGFLPGVPGCTDYSNVYGLKLGAPLVAGYGRVCGLEPSFFYSGTNYIYGVQASWFGPSISREVEGFQASGAVNITHKMTGCQAGTSNVANKMLGFQTGGVCVTTDELDGFQLSAVNVADCKMKGFQFGAVNVATDEVKGVQMGAFNYSDKQGIQIGVFNVIKNGVIPFTILFNYAK